MSRREWVHATAILLVGWFAFLIYAYPGFMSFDSVVQLREARAGIFTDWHPPAMAALWRLVEHVVAGPVGMLVLQSVAFLAGTFLILRTLVSLRIAAALAVAILLFPPVGTTLAVIWKDSQMLGYLALGTGLLLGGKRSKLAGLVVLTLCSAMRHNAFTFTLPIVVALMWWDAAASRLKRYAIAFGSWLLVTATAVVINAALTDIKTYPWHGSLAIFDIVGTLRYTADSDDVIRDELPGVFAGTDNLRERINNGYSPFDGVFRIVDKQLVRQPTNELERDAIATGWRTIVMKHPIGYLHHRWKAFWHLLALPDVLHEWVWVGIDEIGQDLYPYEPGPVQQRLQDIALRFGRTWLMRPYFYLLLVISLIPMVVRSRSTLLTALALSAVMSEAALFFLSPTPDFRYSVWLVPVSAMLVIGLVAKRISAGRPIRSA